MGTKKGVLSINLHNQSRAGTRGEQIITKHGLGWRGVARGMYHGLRPNISERNLKHGTFERQRLPKLIRSALGWVSHDGGQS